MTTDITLTTPEADAATLAVVEIAAVVATVVAAEEEIEFKRLLLTLRTARTCSACGHRDLKVGMCCVNRNGYSVNSSVSHNYEWLCLECAC